MHVTTKTHDVSGTVAVHVDANELQCKHRKMPFPTCIGVIKPDMSGRDDRKGYCKILIWIPGVSGLPRGYKDAAREMLVTAALAQGLMVDQASFRPQDRKR